MVTWRRAPPGFARNETRSKYRGRTLKRTLQKGRLGRRPLQKRNGNLVSAVAVWARAAVGYWLWRSSLRRRLSSGQRRGLRRFFRIGGCVGLWRFFLRLNGDKFHLKDECRVGTDIGASWTRTVSELGRNI